MKRVDRDMRWVLVSAAIFLLAGCMSDVVGAIPPSQFQFRTVAPLRKEVIGGWKAAQVVITLGSRYGLAVCKIEIGVPLVNKDGAISDERAQAVAAVAADRAARTALANPVATAMSATLCRAFMDEMEKRPSVNASSAVTGGDSDKEESTLPAHG